MNKLLFSLMGLLIIGGLGWSYIEYRGSNQKHEPSNSINSNTPATEKAGTSETKATDNQLGNNEDRSTVKEFIVNGRDFSFSPANITVSKGDSVKIIFKNVGGFHDLVIDGYNVGTSKIQAGGESTVEFTADKAGTFEYYCSVGSHRAKGMVGTFIVK